MSPVLKLKRFISFICMAIILPVFYITDIAPAFAAGVDTLECRGKSCTRCVACCTEDSVDEISQNLFNKYRQEFIMDTFYTVTVEPSFKKFADEIRNAENFKTVAFGTFIDASVLLDTLRDLQVSATKTMQDYTPSEQMCRFGTLSRSLAASDQRVDVNRLALSEIGLARNLGTKLSVADAGRGWDNFNRLRFLAERFCDRADNRSGMDDLCVIATQSLDINQDRDVDYTRSVDTKETINADFTDVALTNEEAQLVGLSHYLYGHHQQNQRFDKDGDFKDKPGSATLYRDFRSAFARRAAAQNTYNTLAAMKVAGSGASNAYMLEVLKDLGAPPEEIEQYLLGMNTYDGSANASYNSQMDMLTRRLYQSPKFYANLMDSKANIKRVGASIQGIGLMQDRDIYRSMERSEMLLALMVQLEAAKVANYAYGIRE